MRDALFVALFVAALVGVLRSAVPAHFLARGRFHEMRGDLDRAERWFRKVLAFERGIRSLRGVALACSRLGFLHHRQRRVDDAARMFTAAIDIYSRLGRTFDSAPVIGALGKLYFDAGEWSLADKALNEALAIYCRRGGSDEAIDTIHRLLQLLAERRGATQARTYVNARHHFSIDVPENWVVQRLLPEFARSGGQVAISHATHKATFSVSVGANDLVNVDERARALATFVAGAPDRVGDVEMTSGRAVGGEPNTVCAEYVVDHGPRATRRYGVMTIVYRNVEYCLNWSAMADYENDVRAIVSSFKFVD
jgi:tetratricopeptide (TPR) repeat protein